MKSEDVIRECKIGTEVQSLLFPVEHYSPKEAIEWARVHGFVVRKRVEVGSGYLRIRQKDPKSFRPGSLRIIWLGSSGVRAIIGCPKKKSKKRRR